jgi:DNA mismatch endonuclease (patch repair protein)
VKIDMARIGPSKQTKPERTVRMHLVSLGLRHSCNDRSLPGSPDLVVAHLRLAIFVDGRFWHCERTSKMRGMSAYWRAKLEANARRDRRQRRRLRAMGWLVLRVWDDAVKRGAHRAAIARAVARASAS